MEYPKLVSPDPGQRHVPSRTRSAIAPTLPPISAYAFADIIRSADGPEFRSAIEEIAQICARNRLSLAEEYAAHMPPVGEITEASSQRVKPQLRKPGMRRALTSVPEGSSGSSEGSRASKRRNIFGFRTKEEVKMIGPRVIRIGSMGRSISVAGTTAIAKGLESIPDTAGSSQETEFPTSLPQRSSSAAAMSLQRLLGTTTPAPD